MTALNISRAYRAVYRTQNRKLVKSYSISLAPKEDETWHQKLDQVEWLWKTHLLQYCIRDRNSIQRQRTSDKQEQEIKQYEILVSEPLDSDSDSDGYLSEVDSHIASDDNN